MNDVLNCLSQRKSVRSFEDRPIDEKDRYAILEAAIQAPTAGNQTLYTILDIEDQRIKDELALSCDDQPFIAKAPMVLVFLADCQKWLDAYGFAKARARPPEAGDLLLACSDALIAAQNAVMAAESLGIGSCYIGDILENHEKHVELLKLGRYVLPVTMLVLGYPTEQQRARPKPRRFSQGYVVQKNSYSRMDEASIRAMFEERHNEEPFDFEDYMDAFCKRKYMSGFARELNRSVAKYLEAFGDRQSPDRD